MKERIVKKDEMTMAAVKGRTTKANNQIGRIWQEMFQKKSSVTEPVDHRVLWGVGEYADPAAFTNTTEYSYWACIEVNDISKVPEDFECKIIPAGRWAVFTHKGSLEKLPETFDYIYSVWVLNTKEEIREADDMEYYDERFNPADPENSEIDIYIPIK